MSETTLTTFPGSMSAKSVSPFFVLWSMSAYISLTSCPGFKITNAGDAYRDVETRSKCPCSQAVFISLRAKIARVGFTGYSGS